MTVGRQEDATPHPAEGHERKSVEALGGRQQFHRKPERRRPPVLATQFLHSFIGTGDAQGPDLGPPRRRAQLRGTCFEPAIGVDRVHHHAGEWKRAAELTDQAGRVERRARGELVALEHDDVGLAALGQVVGDRSAPDAPADHDDPGTIRQRSLGHVDC